jgi:hypothetical protein
MSAIAKVASLWDIELEAPERAREREQEDDPKSPFAARCHLSIDGKPAVPMSEVERDLVRGALLYALVHIESFSSFAAKNDKWQRPPLYQLNALLHGLSHVLESGEASPRDTRQLAEWRKSQPRLVTRKRRVYRRFRHHRR